MTRPVPARITLVCSVAALACASSDPAGVVLRPQLETICAVAGVPGPPLRSDGIDSSGDEPDSGDGIVTTDEEWARVAEVVPGGFAGLYLDTAGGLVVRFVRPDEREAGLAALQRELGGRGFDFTRATVIGADYDWAQLMWYSQRIDEAVSGRDVIVLHDIDEGLNRIVLGVVDEETRERVAREVLALEDVPCGAVVIKLSEIGIPDAG